MIAPETVLQDRYRILAKVGGGGMGTVFQAEDMRLPGHLCAIKAFTPENLPQADRTWALTYFRQEAQMLATLNHPGLARVSNFFNEGEVWFLVMDWVDGQTLGDYLRAVGGSLNPQKSVAIIDQLCDVLEYLHRQQPPVIFRDLKPSNIMVTPQGQVKLIDFGTARFFKPEQTRDTVNLGTPGYAAPEQYGGIGQSDARADIYSLGVVLHEMLTGHNPTITPFRLPPVTSLNPNASHHLESIIQQATSLEVVNRFQTIADVRRALHQPDVEQEPAESFPPSIYTPPAAEKKRMPVWLIGGVLGVGFIICAIGAFFVYRLIIPNNVQPTLEWIPTNTPPVTETTPTETPSDTPTQTPTAEPELLPSPTLDFASLEQNLLNTITYRPNNGTVIFAYRAETAPLIDGDLGEWTGTNYPVPYKVYDPDNTWTGPDDLAADFRISWDADFLYLAVQVTDDIHAQNESSDTIFKGDDVDLQIDADLAGDFTLDSLSEDDGQVGLSPGNLQNHSPESYIWLPAHRETSNTGINIAATKTTRGYNLESAIPWAALGGRPEPETPVGLNVNISDNDDVNNAVQQVMISTSPNRTWSNPQTWGTLIIVDW